MTGVKSERTKQNKNSQNVQILSFKNPYLGFVILSKQQLTTSFSVLRRCYQIICVQILVRNAKFTKYSFGNTGQKTILKPNVFDCI